MLNVVLPLLDVKRNEKLIDLVRKTLSYLDTILVITRVKVSRTPGLKNILVPPCIHA